MTLNDDLILFNLKAESWKEVINSLGNRLHDKGFVKDSFITGVLAREEKYPTGLPTSPYGIAIPHTDADKVVTAQVAFANLEKPVKFKSMGNAAEDVDVSVVFMLALNEPEKQLQMLQKLMSLFQDGDTVKALGEVRDVDTLLSLTGL